MHCSVKSKIKEMIVAFQFAQVYKLQEYQGEFIIARTVKAGQENVFIFIVSN